MTWIDADKIIIIIIIYTYFIYTYFIYYFENYYLNIIHFIYFILLLTKKYINYHMISFLSYNYSVP